MNLQVDDPMFDEAVTGNFQDMLRTLLMCYMAIALIGILFIFEGPDHQSEVKRDESDPSKHSSVKEMLLSPNFLLLYLMSSLSVFTGFFVINQTKVYGMLNGLTNDSYLATVASIGSVFGTLRFVWSTVLDYSTYRLVYSTLLVTQILLCLTVSLIATSPVLYAAWISLFVFCEAGHFTLVPNILKRIYGDKAT